MKVLEFIGDVIAFTILIMILIVLGFFELIDEAIAYRKREKREVKK